MLKSLIKLNRRFYYLDVRKNCLGDEGVRELAPALKYTSSLVHLDLSSNELGTKGGSRLFKALLVNESITSVDISSHEGLHRNRIGALGLRRAVDVLRTNKILSILNLSGNGIRLEGLLYLAEGLAGNHTLLSLKIALNEIQGSPQCVQALKTIILDSKLRELDLNDNPLGNSSIESLAQLLEHSGMSLRRLYCANIGITCT